MERNPFENKNQESRPTKSHWFSSYSKNYAKGVQYSDSEGIVNRSKTELKATDSMNSTSVAHTDLQQTPSKIIPPPVATISPRIKMR